MIWISLGLAVAGLFLSAFFSGSETGFYRATRVRLVLDALGGDWIARGLLMLTNHPSLFIATTLVGNNLANYVTSLAIVMGVQAMMPTYSHVGELLAPLLLAPVLFVYGELLPKNLFLHAPNRLLKAGGPLFLLFVPLFFPISALLWLLNRMLARFGSGSPEEVRLALARRELQRVVEEGHEAGILHPSQRGLAQGIFALANRPVGHYVAPLSDVPRARTDMTKEEVLRLARRYRLAAVPVEDASQQQRLVGYVRVIDLGLDPSEQVGPLRALMEIPEQETHINALLEMENAQESLALVTGDDGRPVGILTVHRLHEALFRGGRAA